MSDDERHPFDGIDAGTFSSSRLTRRQDPTDATSILRDINAAIEAMHAAQPNGPCGSEKNPHAYFGGDNPGRRVRCAVCTEEFIVMPNGRGLPTRDLALDKMIPIPRLTMPDPDLLTDAALATSYAYRATLAPRAFFPVSVGYDEGFEFSIPRRAFLRAFGWRRGKRPVQPRGKRRTDFGARGVSEPTVG
jgi:hypothetical protein